MFDFPATPGFGQIQGGPGGISYSFDGVKWVAPSGGGGSGGSATGSLPLTGGAMQGPLSLVGNAAANLQAVPLQQLHVQSVLDHGAVGDGVTDDTAAIQNVLNTYAGKAVVLIPWTGHNYMTKALTIPSCTDLLLEGTLQALPGLAGGYINLSSANNITIRGIGTIDGNKLLQAGATGNLAGIAISQCGNVRITGITLSNAFNWNLNATQSNTILIDRVNFTGGGNAPEFAAACDSCWLTNCILDGTGNGDYVFAFYGGVTNSGAIGNVLRNGAKGLTGYSPPGIGVLSDAGQPLPCRNIIIADNIIYNNGGPGIQVEGSTTAGIATGIVIANNRSYNNNQIGMGGIAGADIFIDYAQGVTITGNNISGNGNRTAGTYFTGIFIGAHGSQLNITNNQIYNIGQGLGGPGTNGTNAGIYAQNTADAFICNNHFYDNQTTPTMQNSIVGGVGARSCFLGNYFGLPFNAGTVADTMMANAGPAPGQNLIVYGTQSLGPPTFTTRSIGTKLVLFPNVTGTSVDYGFGVNNNQLYASIPAPASTYGFLVYAGQTPVMNMNGAGSLSVSGNYTINGVNVVMPRIGGWGTPTGGTRTANFPGATATPAQTAATLAQLLLDLETHGLIGA